MRFKDGVRFAFAVAALAVALPVLAGERRPETLALAVLGSPALAASEPVMVRDAPLGQRMPFTPEAAARTPLVIGSTNHVLYPTSANVHGAYGAFFKTKMTLLNVTSQSFSIRAGFSTGAGEISAKWITLPAGQAITFDNVVNDVFGLTGGGSVDLDSRPYDGLSNHFFMTNAVVYVDVGGGGRYYMAVQPADLFGFIIPNRNGLLVGVSVNGTTRTNVGCASNSSSTLHLTAWAVDAQGNVASDTFGFDMGPYAWGQVSITGSFTNGTIVVQTNDPAGAACYATEINNVTNDATFYLAVPL